MESTLLKHWFAIMCTITIPVLITAGEDSGCYYEGQPINFICVVSKVYGVLIWRGIGFVCTRDNTGENNMLPLLTADCSEEGSCGPYHATLSCLENGSYVSNLTFTANYAMNGEAIECSHLNQVVKTFPPLKVGVIPKPAMNAQVSFPSGQECRYDWEPPEENITGGIEGYNLTAYGNCGICRPLGMVNKTTLFSLCTEWIAMGQTCHFEIRTVTADCGFLSDPANVTSILDDTSPSSVMVALTCSQNANHPTVCCVEWEYTPVEAADTTFFPQVMGFYITFSDKLGNSFSQNISNSTVRSQYINSTKIDEAGLVGDFRTVTVAVSTEAGVFSSGSSINFSVEWATTNASPTLTERQCIEVSINSFCNENADSFQVQLKYAEGMCGAFDDIDAVSIPTSNYPRTENYTTCINISAIGSICYSALVYHHGVVVGRTEPQQLILLPCDTSSLSEFNVHVAGSKTRVGKEVPHYTLLNLECKGCSLCGILQTRCINGTMELGTIHCSICYSFISLVVVVVPVVVIIIVIIVVVVRYCGYHTYSTNETEKPCNQLTTF